MKFDFWLLPIILTPIIVAIFAGFQDASGDASLKRKKKFVWGIVLGLFVLVGVTLGLLLSS